MSGRAGLLGALGGVAIAFALVDLFMGIFATQVDPIWIGGNLVVGVALLGAAGISAADSLRERLRSGEARRAGRYGTSAVLSTVLMIAILGGLGFLATRYHKRFDWSEAGVHSLADQTRQVLETLPDEVHALALYREIDAEPARQLLDRYAYQSDRFRVEIADPNERPDLLQRHAIDPGELGQGLVRIALGGESTLVKEVNEENLTNAIVKLTRTGDKLVYFLQGHNERPVDGDGAKGRDGYGRAADALRNENYQVESLLLAAAPDVPEDADVVAIAGITRPLLTQEREALGRYVERGGALLVLVDPRAKTDLVDDLHGWGVDVGDDIVIDRVLALFGQAMTPIAQRYAPNHDITRGMSSADATIFHVVRSVRAAVEPPGDFSEIVFTGDTSWAERDIAQLEATSRAELGDGDIPGPVPIAVAGTPRRTSNPSGDGEESSEEGAGPARMVVFGDADFASNELIETYNNRDLFLNSVNWLMGDVEAISIRPVRSPASRFDLSQQTWVRIRSLSLFVLPEAIAVLGVFVWWSRRWSPAR